jgi:hypothetical protein
MVQHLQYAPGHKSESRLGTGQQSSSGVSGVVFDMSVLYKHPLRLCSCGGPTSKHGDRVSALPPKQLTTVKHSTWTHYYACT